MEPILNPQETEQGTIIDKISEWQGDINNIKVPVIFKDLVLFSSGIRNGVEYSDEEIRNATERARKNLPLYLDHRENVGDYIGVVKNFRYEQDKAIGDAYVFDKFSAQKMIFSTQSNFPFGISPRITFIPNENKATQSNFDSFSIVLTPADPNTILNNKMESQNPQEKPQEIKQEVKTNEEIKQLKQELERIETEREKEKVINLEGELGIQISKFADESKENLKGMETAYQKIKEFVETAINLDLKQSQNVDNSQPEKQFKSAERQMFELCTKSDN